MPDIFKDEFPERELPNGRAMIQFKCYVDERIELLCKRQKALTDCMFTSLGDVINLIRTYNAIASGRARPDDAE